MPSTLCPQSGQEAGALPASKYGHGTSRLDGLALCFQRSGMWEVQIQRALTMISMKRLISRKSGGPYMFPGRSAGALPAILAQAEWASCPRAMQTTWFAAVRLLPIKKKEERRNVMPLSFSLSLSLSLSLLCVGRSTQDSGSSRHFRGIRVLS